MHQEHLTSFPNLYFPVANPTPLSKASKIPQPIILPPGSDPYSTPIPDTILLDELVARPELDIDPCVASRREIMAQTSYITPSEHAGGALNETTKVSATLRSSDNSEIVTQHVVNDVIETTMQNKNTQSLHCEVCNVTCYSEDVFKCHKQGKRHLKNLQKLAISSAVAPKRPPAVATATLDGELEKKKRNLLQDGASVNSLMFSDICDVVCNNQETFEKHLEGQKHDTQVTSGPSSGNGLSNSTSPSTTPFKLSNSSTQEQAEQKSNDAQSEWCELCKVSCSNKTIYNRHITGKRHLKNLKNSQKIPGPLPTPVNSVATTPITVPVEDRKPISGRSSEGGFSNRSTSPVQPSDSTVQKQSEEKSNDAQSEWCEVCKVRCSNMTIFNGHLAGKKHMKNLKKCQKISGPLLIPITLVATAPITWPVANQKSTRGLSRGDEFSNLMSVSTSPVQPSDSTVQKQADEKLNISQHASDEPCKVSCSSDKVLKNKESEKMPSPLSTPIAPIDTKPVTGVVENLKSTSGLSCKVELPNLTLVSTSPKPSNSTIEKQAEEKPDISQPASDELCKVSYSIDKVLENNLKESEKIPGLFSTLVATVATTKGIVKNSKSTMDRVVNSKGGQFLQCELCGISCNTYEVLHRHISGKKHQKNVKKSQQPIGPKPAPATQPATAMQIIGPLQDSVNEVGKVVDLESHKRKANGSVASDEDLETKKQKMMISGATSDSLRTCTLCDVVCNGPVAFIAHLGGRKHAAKAAKQAEAGLNGQKA